MSTTNAGRAVAGLAGFGLLAAGITSAVLVAGSTTPAAAADLTRFESCDDIAAWTTSTAPGTPVVGQGEGGGFAREESADAASGAPASAGAAPAPAGADTGGTNTVVQGVDEIDVVDRLDDGRALVSRNGALSVVDLSGPQVLSHVAGLPYDARISVAGDVVWVAGSDDDGSGVDVRRFRLDGDTLTDDGAWSTPGFLIDARRTDGGLHVVAVDHPGMGAIPFEGGPVPCDQVWHPEGGADTPAATLLVTLPADGELAPTAAAEVVGSGSGFLVTGDAAYVTTQTFTDTATTGIHRFDLATLAPTGSGSVPGYVPGPFGLDEHEGHLRVATSEQGAFGIAIDGPAADVVGPTPQSSAGPLAEVFVLDLDGALDVVGSTGRFGHDGETIHGVRFVGDTAYVVTFLQTDPFWVIDLADPTTPTIVGELAIPGFSAYLHPVGDGQVVGFGPDGQGQVAARLFDVSDPANPTLVDELPLADDSPVAWDHHALVALDDGSLAVPVNKYPVVVTECGVGDVGVPEPLPLPEPLPPAVPEPRPIDPGVPGAPGMPVCEPVFGGGSTGVAVLAVDGSDLVVTDDRRVDSDGSFAAERVLPAGDEWVLVGWDRLVSTNGTELVLPAG